MDIYIVKPGDALDQIAVSYGTTPEDLSYINQIPYPYQLAVGQALLVPAAVSRNTGRSAVANGYAYPFISPWVLRQTLPYLSALLVFSYGFTVEGELLPPTLSDDWMLETAAEFGRASVLTLTPLGPDGRFNNNLIHEMLQNEESRERLMEELLAEMQGRGFSGVDVDFEYILATDKAAFSGFVAEAAAAMHGQGFMLSVALVSKTYAEQPGLLYEGMDYAALGAVADLVLLMTYEWGYTYSEPMPIAPLNWVRRVLAYAVTEIAPEKILLGIPNYAYDWTLPYVKGESRARTLGVVQAMQQAADLGAEIFFDEAVQTPYYNYTLNGLRHEVWFEDVRSLQARFQLVQEFKLAGGGWWQLMRLFICLILICAIIGNN